jgi:CubicO group peptidase (beta-lactamase class C family)
VLEPIRAAHRLPALGAAVFSSDATLAIGAVGVRKLGDATRVERADAWHLGSDTKAMTATLLALYVAEGRVAWTTTMARAFPEPLDPGYRDVTVEQLLWHRGGAPHDVPGDLWAEMWKPGGSRPQRRAAVLGMLQRPPAVTPGSQYLYANAGYMMAGAALEDAVDEDWESLMRRRLFAPLAMASCGFGAPASLGKVDHPWGHVIEEGAPVPRAPGPTADNPPSLGPAGTVHCGLVDWGKFLQLHLRAARGLPTALLDAAAIVRLQTPPAGADYAAGWGTASRDWAGGPVLTHSGTNTMFYVTTWIAPKKDRILVAVTNVGGPGAPGAVDAVFAPLIARFVR